MELRVRKSNRRNESDEGLCGIPAMKRRYKSPSIILLRKLTRSKTAVFGMVVVTLICMCAILSPVLSPYNPTEVRPGLSLQPPGKPFLLGTDLLGRDILSRLIWGSRVALRVGIGAMGLSALIGLLLGAVGAYYGGALDNLINRIMDVIFAFPILLLAIVIVVATSNSGEFSVIMALGIAYVPSYCRVVRSTVISIRESEYIEACRLLGFSDLRIILRHVVPNCLFSLIVVFTLFVGYAILTEASLSFLGMGTQPPTPSWGLDLQAGIILVEVAPWVVIFPGLAIMASVLGFNMLGDGLRDALDPRLKL